MDNKKGKLIVIDGLDGCGKSTQADIIYQQLKSEGENVKLISYPNYAMSSSSLVKMYLDGEFGHDLNEVNAYAASSFYAVDHYAGFKLKWQKHYERGYTIIATRYVTSNAVYQMVKLPQDGWDGFLSWLDDYEYCKLGLPRPDLVIFLDMKRTIANSLLISRYDGDASKRDIHESNMEYMELCQSTARYSAEKLDWNVVMCGDDESAFPVNEITEKILQVIKSN